jgi:lysozyme
MQHVNGIDVSGFQDPVDFMKVRGGGYSFAYAKCTQGSGFYESTYAAKRTDAYQAGVLFGAYHFMDWTADAHQQAAWFLTNAKPKNGDLPPVLDCEWDDSVGPFPLEPDAAIAHVATWLNVVLQAVKTFPVIYLNPNFWRTKLAATDGFSGHPLWLAEYGVAAPESLNTWAPKLWQYSSTGTVPGIANDVDLDWFLGDMAELNNFRLSKVP